MVNYPELVRVTIEQGENTTVFQIKCAKSDFGAVLGKGGKNIAAIRVIVTGASTKERKRSVVELLE